MLRHRELIVAYAKREFHAVHRDTILGIAWSIVTPLILLAIFTLVFGVIFNGRFRHDVNEGPAEFALALFVGLSFFNCIGQTLTGAPGLVLANAIYVKTLSFPVEVLTVATVANVLTNLVIGLGLCFLAFFLMHGFLYPSSICLVAYILCVALMCLGLSWFLSSLAVFVRDVAAITSPLSMVLMFLSSVFFPIEAVPKRIVWLIELNPIAIIVDQARGCFLYGRWPDPLALGTTFVISVAIAVAGYWFFVRAKPSFADVI